MQDSDSILLHESIIHIPGVQRPHHFLHISDTHVGAWDALSSPEEKEKVLAWEQKGASDLRKLFEEYIPEPNPLLRGKSSQESFRLISEFIEKEQRHGIDGLIFSGDNYEFPASAGRRYFCSALNEFKKQGADILCVPGNHESAPDEDLWTGEISVLDYDGFSLIGIDDSLKTVSSLQLNQLEQALSRGIPSIIVIHIPIVTDFNCAEMRGRFQEYSIFDGNAKDPNAQKFVALLEQSQSVQAILCGHVHEWHASEFVPGKMQYCSSASLNGNLHRITVCE